MQETGHLWVFFVMVFGVILLPGLDMAFVLASSLVGGRRAGLAATAGIVAFNAVLLAGAAYIGWIGHSWRALAWGQYD